MERYSLILLDADETLFDFRRAEEYALERSFAQYGLEVGDALFRDYDAINKELWSRLERGEIDQSSLKVERFRLLFEKEGIDEDARAFASCYIAWLSKASFLLDGAAALCEYLSAKYRLALVTNGIKEVQRSRFDLSPIKQHFSALAISEEAGSSKPDAGIFDYACDLLGFHEKDKMIMIGDSLSSDIRGAANYGIDSCWYNPGGLRIDGGPRPTYEVRSLAEIRGIL